jgi:DNA-directed RNA polymerase specialized sigma24 family protein
MPKGQIESDELLWVRHKGGVLKICRSFATTYGLDFTELLSEALVVFVEACRTYDGRTTPEAWVYVRLRRRLRDVMEAERVRARLARDDVDLDSLPCREPHRGGLDMSRFSPPAAAVVALALDRPRPVEDRVRERGGPSPKNIRLSIRDYLRSAGWTVRTVLGTFAEIKRELNRDHD